MPHHAVLVAALVSTCAWATSVEVSTAVDIAVNLRTDTQLVLASSINLWYMRPTFAGIRASLVSRPWAPHALTVIGLAVADGGNLLVEHTRLAASNASYSSLVECDGAYADVKDSVVREARASGLRVESGGVATVRDVDVLANAAIDGGGLSVVRNASLNASGLTIDGNTASRHGGGLAVVNESFVVIRATRVTNNEAGDCGGGVYLFRSIAELRDVTIAGNQARRGGGLCVVDSNVTLIDVVVEENDAFLEGGGVRVVDSVVSNAQFLVRDRVQGGQGGRLVCWRVMCRDYRPCLFSPNASLY